MFLTCNVCGFSGDAEDNFPKSGKTTGNIYRNTCKSCHNMDRRRRRYENIKIELIRNEGYNTISGEKFTKANTKVEFLNETINTLRVTNNSNIVNTISPLLHIDLGPEDKEYTKVHRLQDFSWLILQGHEPSEILRDMDQYIHILKSSYKYSTKKTKNVSADQNFDRTNTTTPSQIYQHFQENIPNSPDMSSQVYQTFQPNMSGQMYTTPQVNMLSQIYTTPKVNMSDQIYTTPQVNMSTQIYPIFRSNISSQMYPTSNSNITSQMYPTSNTNIPSQMYPTSNSNIPSQMYATSNSNIPSQMYSTSNSDIPSQMYPTSNSNIPSQIYPTSDSNIPSQIYPTSDSNILSQMYPTFQINMPTQKLQEKSSNQLNIPNQVNILNQDNMSNQLNIKSQSIPLFHENKLKQANGQIQENNPSYGDYLHEKNISGQMVEIPDCEDYTNENKFDKTYVKREPMFEIIEDVFVLPYPFVGKHFNDIRNSFVTIFEIDEQKRTIRLPYPIPEPHPGVNGMDEPKYRNVIIPSQKKGVRGSITYFINEPID